MLPVFFSQTVFFFLWLSLVPLPFLFVEFMFYFGTAGIPEHILKRWLVHTHFDILVNLTSDHILERWPENTLSILHLFNSSGFGNENRLQTQLSLSCETLASFFGFYFLQWNCQNAWLQVSGGKALWQKYSSSGFNFSGSGKKKHHSPLSKTSANIPVFFVEFMGSFSTNARRGKFYLYKSAVRKRWH